MSKPLATHCYMVEYPAAKKAKYTMLAITRGGWASRRSAIAAFLKSLKGPPVTWKQLYARGCRVVWVKIIVQRNG